MKLVFVDSETTGLNPSEGHEAFQWAFIIEINRKVVDEFEILVRPKNWDATSQQALDVNKRTVDELKTFPEASVGHAELIQRLGKHVNKYDKVDKFFWVGKNPQFDVGFCEAWFKGCGDKYFGSWFDRRLLDPTTILVAARILGHIKPVDYKLGTLCDLLGVKLGESAHDALADVRATRELFHVAMDRFMKRPETAKVPAAAG